VTVLVNVVVADADNVEVTVVAVSVADDVTVDVTVEVTDDVMVDVCVESKQVHAAAAARRARAALSTATASVQSSAVLVSKYALANENPGKLKAL